MKTKIYHLNESDIDFIAAEVAKVLKNGGIAIVPTDTIYGIVAIDSNDDAVDRIYQIKKRPKDKKLIRLIGNLELLKKYTNQYPEKLINKYWPGPLTIVFKSKDQDTVAIRYPNDNFLHSLFKHIGKSAIVAPSANISGNEILTDCKSIIDEFYGKVEIIACKDEPIEAEASTIIDVSNEDEWKILRQGRLKIKI